MLVVRRRQLKCQSIQKNDGESEIENAGIDSDPLQRAKTYRWRSECEGPINRRAEDQWPWQTHIVRPRFACRVFLSSLGDGEMCLVKNDGSSKIDRHSLLTYLSISLKIDDVDECWVNEGVKLLRRCFSFVSICVCTHVPPLQSRINWWRQRSCCFFFISFSRTPGERERMEEREEKEEIQEEFDHQKPNDERDRKGYQKKQSSDREVARVNDDICLAIRDQGTYRWQTRDTHSISVVVWGGAISNNMIIINSDGFAPFSCSQTGRPTSPAESFCLRSNSCWLDRGIVRYMSVGILA